MSVTGPKNKVLPPMDSRAGEDLGGGENHPNFPTNRRSLGPLSRGATGFTHFFNSIFSMTYQRCTLETAGVLGSMDLLESLAFLDNLRSLIRDV